MERGFDLDAAQAASLLDWWTLAGVDCLVDERPRDWLAASAAKAPAARRQEAPAPVAPAQVTPAQVTPASPALPDQLPLFREWLRTSDAVPFASTAAPRVCPAGDPASGLMIVTAMPSAEDCARGTMLSGAAGRLFDRMLAAIGRDRDGVYIAGLSCLRPAGGRLDSVDSATCAEIARHHIGLVSPRAILLLGDASARALLGVGMAQARGRVHRVETPGAAYKAVVTLSPDYLLGQPAAKAMAWLDLQLLMETLA